MWQLDRTMFNHICLLPKLSEFLPTLSISAKISCKICKVSRPDWVTKCLNPSTHVLPWLSDKWKPSNFCPYFDVSSLNKQQGSSSFAIVFDTWEIRVITKLPNSEQSYKGKVKTHNYINRQNQSTTGKLWKRNDPHLRAFILFTVEIDESLLAFTPASFSTVSNTGLTRLVVTSLLSNS